MDMLIKKINVDHVIVAQTMEKVEEFVIEHILGKPKEPEGEDSADGDKKRARIKRKNHNI